MSDQPDNSQPSVESLDRGLLVVALVAFLGLLAAYVALAITGKDAEGVVRLATTLAAVFGLGAAQRVQHRATTRKLNNQNVALARITSQTNGELDDRIEQAVVKALRVAGVPKGVSGP